MQPEEGAAEEGGRQGERKRVEKFDKLERDADSIYRIRTMSSLANVVPTGKRMFYKKQRGLFCCLRGSNLLFLKFVVILSERTGEGQNGRNGRKVGES